MANGRANVLSRIAGIERIEDRLSEQDKRSDERHKANTDRLEEVKALGEETVKEVSQVKERTTVIEDRASEIAKRKLVALGWKQGLVLSLLSGGGVYLIVHLA